VCDHSGVKKYEDNVTATNQQGELIQFNLTAVHFLQETVFTLTKILKPILF